MGRQTLRDITPWKVERLQIGQEPGDPERTWVQKLLRNSVWYLEQIPHFIYWGVVLSWLLGLPLSQPQRIKLTGTWWFWKLRTRVSCRQFYVPWFFFYLANSWMPSPNPGYTPFPSEETALVIENRDWFLYSHSWDAGEIPVCVPPWLSLF